MLCVSNLDSVLLSGLIPVAYLEVEVHQCPFGWMKFSVLPETVTCLSVVMLAGDIMTVHTLKMLVWPALEQVCYEK